VVAADRRGKARARRACNRSGDPPVGTLGRGSAGQNAEGAEPRVECCPYAFFRGRDTVKINEADRFDMM
jgi:hypothetical protein